MADNPFQKILKSVSDFFKTSQSKEGSVVGVDIGTSSIKVVQLKEKGGKAVLETYGELSLGPYAETEVGTLTNLQNDKLTQAIIDTLRESEITTKTAAVSISSTSSLLFVMDIPSSFTEKELSTIVPTEARKYIPVPITEVTLDWWIIPKREEENESQLENQEDGASVKSPDKTEVLVSAIHNDTISRYKDVSKAGGLEVDTFEIEAFSSIRSAFGHEVSAVLLIDVGASKTKLYIVDHGIVRAFHIINRGGYDISNGISKSLDIPFARAEQLKREEGLLGEGDKKNISDIARLSVDYIFSETNSVILNYEKKYNKPISKIIISGGGALLKGLLGVAEANFRTEIVLADPFAKTEVPAFLQNVLKSIGPEFSVATGLALRKLK